VMRMKVVSDDVDVLTIRALMRTTITDRGETIGTVRSTPELWKYSGRRIEHVSFQ
jgi:hypothetical protein